jgi:hypothetical protein
VQVYFFIFDEYAPKASAITNAVMPGTKGAGEAICDLPYSWAAGCTATKQPGLDSVAACGAIMAGPK